MAARTTKLEAQQAAASRAQADAEAKLAEANKMIDDSLLVATKRQQENKALQEEVRAAAVGGRAARPERWRCRFPQPGSWMGRLYSASATSGLRRQRPVLCSGSQSMAGSHGRNGTAL